MVLKTYALLSKEISLGNQKIILCGTKELLSNSAYITDGGTLDESIILSKKNLNGITTPILLKYRSPITISADIKHVLITDYYTFVLDLSGGKEEIWKNSVKSKTRNQVRKAQKANYTVKFGKLDLLDDFYTVISTAWRDLGTPTHSKDFYKNIVQELAKSKEFSAEFIVMYIGEKPVSAACLIQDSSAIHHPYAATLKQYNHLSLNNALYWEIILQAIEKRISYFDLGRSKKDQGTAAYKKSWGAIEVPLYYYYLNKSSHQNEEENKTVQFLIEVWKKLPLKIANFMGPKFIYKVLK
jgi:lipid II:glycine glycyltransferase (peptidoglycan interpeptide bridge formation enzyme)